MIRQKLYKVVIFWVVLMAMTALIGEVTIAATNVGRTAADFLMIGQGARAAGLGGAYTAVSNGAIAAYWNPAGLNSMEQGEVALGHFSWLQDITVEQASVALPVSSKLTTAFSITYVNYGTINGYDASGLPTEELSAYDWSGGLSFGYGFNEAVSLGLTGKYVSQRLDDLSASAFAFDLGAKYVGYNFALAASVVNVGSEMKFEQVSEKLPAAARLGVAFRPFTDRVLTSVELEKRFYGDLVIRHGLEYGFDDQYFLRTGYDYLPGQDGRSLAMRLSMGAGIRLDFADFDYAFTPNDKSTTEDLHRFTLTFRFAN